MFYWTFIVKYRSCTVKLIKEAELSFHQSAAAVHLHVHRKGFQLGDVVLTPRKMTLGLQELHQSLGVQRNKIPADSERSTTGERQNEVDEEEQVRRETLTSRGCCG